MTDDSSGGTIQRAKAKVAQWQSDRRQAMAERRFDRCTAAELIKIAETGCDLQGRPLQDGADAMALESAWRSKFGESLAVAVTDGDDAQQEPHDRVPPVDQHPLLSVPDDTMLRPREVRRLLGYARSTLKRDIKAGKFPKPQLLMPGKRHVGWPARQLKAWLASVIDSGQRTRH